MDRFKLLGRTGIGAASAGMVLYIIFLLVVFNPFLMAIGGMISITGAILAVHATYAKGSTFNQ